MTMYLLRQYGTGKHADSRESKTHSSPTIIFISLSTMKFS